MMDSHPVHQTNHRIARKRTQKEAMFSLAGPHGNTCAVWAALCGYRIVTPRTSGASTLARLHPVRNAGSIGPKPNTGLTQDLIEPHLSQIRALNDTSHMCNIV
jgi:hypothetical protein